MRDGELNCGVLIVSMHVSLVRDGRLSTVYRHDGVHVLTNSFVWTIPARA